jgi:hypothetical protein
MKILYLDNCCFNRPFDDQSYIKIKLETEAKLYIQNQILLGKYALIWSYILEFENNQNPFEDRMFSIYDWKKISTYHCVETAEIIKFAESLHEKGIKTKDALHISCAKFSNADYFLTTDKKLLNFHIPDVNIINPLQLINFYE